LLIPNVIKVTAANLKADSSSLLAVDMQASTAFAIELIDERPW
jgi:hypothetical protein